MNKSWIILCMAACLASCWGGFIYEKQLDKSYRFIAIDNRNDMIVCRRFGGANCVGDELPGPTIFAAGANTYYVVIARHPQKEYLPDKSISQYFYVKRAREDLPLRAENVVGPLSLTQFKQDQQRLGLPSFTRIFSDLK